MPEISPWLYLSLGAVLGLVTHALLRLAFQEPKPAPARAALPRRARGPARRRPW